MADPNGPIYSSPVYFDGMVYIQGMGDVLKAYALKLDPATNTMLLDETPVSEGTSVSGFPGEVQSVSADGTQNGIVWDLQVDGFATGSPAILRAYDANDLSKPLYASNQAGPRDTAGGGVKFTTPTIANGHVYLGTQFEVDVYGLLPKAGSASQSVATPAGSALDPGAACPRRRHTRRSGRDEKLASGVIDGLYTGAMPHPPVRPRREARGPPRLSSWRRTPARAQAAGPNPSRPNPTTR